ncbi:MAG: DUF5915 domain-containing protein, partial [Planctomycetota bacterium]|nr:DUF5915 domain-containing protein [Planctomycetota bacterium]
NWYIRRSRRRFWRGADEADGDKENAYRTLHHVLLTLSKVLAPFVPFVAEEMYGNLSGGAKDSVHLEDFPVADPALQDIALERRMELARAAVGLGRGLRAKHDVRTRQPLRSMTVVAAAGEDRDALAAMAGIVKDELNVKGLEVSADEADFVTYSARPNLKLLGPKFGKAIGQIRGEVGGFASEALATVVAGGSIASEAVEGLVYDSESLLVDRSSREGTVVDTDGSVTVALDTTLDEGLVREGLARELVTRIQNLRKDRGLELDDRIEVSVCCDGELAAALKEHWELIAGEVLAVGSCPDPDQRGADAVEFEIDGAGVSLDLQKA